MVLFVEEFTSEQSATVKDMEEKNTLVRELTKAKAAVEDAMKRKRQFLTTMGHEIRTPLFALKGMAQYLTETPLNEDQRSSIDVILSSCDALLNTLTDVLDLAKMEAGAVRTETAEFDIFRIIEDCVDFASAQAQSKGIILSSRFSSALPNKLIGDPGRIKHVRFQTTKILYLSTDPLSASLYHSSFLLNFHLISHSILIFTFTYNLSRFFLSSSPTP